MAAVEYNRDSYNTCLCGGCPVNRASACVKELEEALEPRTEAIERESLMPSPETMPGIYCAVGKSSCGDLSARLRCLCPACPLFLREELGKSYYCLRGSAEEVG